MTKIAVVTGAAGGMGQAICRRMIEEGFSVIGLDMTWPDGTLFDTAVFRAETGDLSDDRAVAEIFDGIATREGHVDVLVNNAGTCFMSDFPEIPAEEFRRQMAVNFDTCFHCCQAAIPLMLGGEGVRKIINISSNGASGRTISTTPQGSKPVAHRTLEAQKSTVTTERVT